jgi:hypothetical protein
MRKSESSKGSGRARDGEAPKEEKEIQEIIFDDPAFRSIIPSDSPQVRYRYPGMLGRILEMQDNNCPFYILQQEFNRYVEEQATAKAHKIAIVIAEQERQRYRPAPYYALSVKYSARDYWFLEEERKPKVEPPFEMNMMEALIGWKRWKLSGDRIISNNGPIVWIPDTPLKAICTTKRCEDAPIVHHGCGIYAVDKEEQTEKNYGPVLGQVFGWGKYVRGEKGWRSQYAYPMRFLLEPGQESFLDVLKLYHVPVFTKTNVVMSQDKLLAVYDLLQVYNPEEEGYYGYWNNGTTRDSGASTDSNASKD